MDNLPRLVETSTGFSPTTAHVKCSAFSLIKLWCWNFASLIKLPMPCLKVEVQYFEPFVFYFRLYSVLWTTCLYLKFRNQYKFLNFFPNSSQEIDWFTKKFNLRPIYGFKSLFFAKHENRLITKKSIKFIDLDFIFFQTFRLVCLFFILYQKNEFMLIINKTKFF